ncbi:MAG: Transmembrane protein YfcA [uncultured Sphingomonadaceae bacterium]|uniref:Probable membrane transporter protein n=1 Tax=uncultured Sphingomonadaceae bacterium TaxID=169976 RepID=A0A6J4S6L4_9SPHN|nr:MAG: Transmembrane protein YfcA [uncultured Sphingomonadaceae bacterium]
MPFGPDVVALLLFAAFVAGCIDAVAGGGGLITLPALLGAGLPPVAALGVNKAQSSFGVAAALLAYTRRGLVDFAGLRWTVLAVFLGSGLGTFLIMDLNAGVARAIIPLLLLGASAYFLLSPKMDEVERHRRLGPAGFGATAAAIGFYDGFFGPGTGSFFALALVALLGFGVTRATANTKLLNFTSNVASLYLLALGGAVLLPLALLMAAASMAGATLGARLALRFGARLIRPLLVVISLGLTARVLLDPANPLRGWFN